MTGFHNFTAPLWELFFGNLLFLLCSLFYLVWWLVCFRPHASGGAAGGVFLAGAFLTGIAALALLAAGIAALSPLSKGLPVLYIVVGGVVSYVVLLLVTSIVFHRAVTSELLIMHIWAVLQLCVVAVLYGAGRFGTGRAAFLAALVGAAAVVGLICYVLYYRLTGAASYRDGMVPLASDAFVMAVFLAVQAFS